MSKAAESPDGADDWLLRDAVFDRVGEVYADDVVNIVRAGSPTEWAVLDMLRAHQCDIGNRGSKPNDPGWHVCSCGWEGYWSDFHPHLAERIVERLAHV